MAENGTTVQVNARLADELKKLLGVKSRTEAARIALTEFVERNRARAPIKKKVKKNRIKVTSGK